MKISKLFHWLYFAVMMLPIFVLPILAIAIRSDNNFVPIEVQSEQYQVVDFNQFIDDSVNTWAIGNDNLVLSKDKQYLSVTGNWGTGGTTQASFCKYTPIYNHIYLVKFNHSIQNYGVIQVNDYREDGLERARNFYQDSTFVSTNALNRTYQIGIYFTPSVSVTYSDYNFYLNVFDLTQMFGAGNEPTIQQFNSWYPNFYQYTLSHKELLNVGSITYNDTDVGSQMVYVTYQAVDNYFNYDNVFNFGSLYSWLELNFFSGNAPLGFFIFWHLLIYWLLTSLIWLIFDVLMYVPLLVHRWLDKASIS